MAHSALGSRNAVGLETQACGTIGFQEETQGGTLGRTLPGRVRTRRALPGMASGWSAFWLFLAMLCACSTAARAQDALPAPDVALHQAGGVAVMARQADGKLLVGGCHVLAGKDFASGAVAISYLHRQNPDGTVDLSFVPSPEGEVTALAVGSSHVYVAGSFTSIGGQPIARLAKVSLANGAVVADWNPAPDGHIYDLVLGADGYLY